LATIELIIVAFLCLTLRQDEHSSNRVQTYDGQRNRSYASRYCLTSHCAFGNAMVRIWRISKYYPVAGIQPVGHDAMAISVLWQQRCPLLFSSGGHRRQCLYVILDSLLIANNG